MNTTMRFNPATATLEPPPAPALEGGPVTSTPVKKLSFAGIATKAAKPKAADKYPAFPADPATAASVDWIIKHHEIPDQLKQAKADLARTVLPFYFQTASGKTDCASSVLVAGATGTLAVTFANRYPTVTEEAIKPILAGRIHQFFRQSFTIEIDGDKIPADAAQGIIDELVNLFQRHQCPEALGVKDGLVPTPEFHAKRHLDLTPDQNLALDAVCRIQARVGIKK
jgi:hypothetical protein